MHILWTYLRPHWRLAALALLLATASQVLALIDPIIFGTIVDEYAIHRAGKTEEQLISGVSRLLALAVLVAVLSRAAKALQEYVTRLVVQRLGTRMFNDGPSCSGKSTLVKLLRAVRTDQRRRVLQRYLHQ